MSKPPAVVVFDVNIYVDIAGLITQPFTWSKFDAVAGRIMNDPVPHHEDAAFDSLRAVAMSRSGTVGTGEKLEVWTSEHIDNLTITKVHQNIRDTANVAWSHGNAVDLHDEMVNTLVFDLSGGGSVGRILTPLNFPPLDYEDGCVMRTAALAGDVTESRRFCVTRDRDFRESYVADELDPTVQVLYPSEWVELLRIARRPDLGRMRRR